MASFCPPRLPSPSPLKRVRAERVGGRRELGRGIKRATGFSWSISAPGCKVPPRKITPRQLSRHRRPLSAPSPPLSPAARTRKSLGTRDISFLSRERTVRRLFSFNFNFATRKYRRVFSYFNLPLSLFSHIMDPESKRIRHMCKGCCP